MYVPQRIHGYISLSICIFGILNNMMSIAVFSRKHMRTALNLMLLSLACTDLYTLISQAILASYFHIHTLWIDDPCRKEGWNYFAITTRGMWFVNSGLWK